MVGQKSERIFFRRNYSAQEAIWMVNAVTLTMNWKLPAYEGQEILGKSPIKLKC
jgi:1,4-dihydroxy-2-naphthoyl-CoA synthase